MSRAIVDLHLHSLYSDGLYSPAALCERAAQAGLTHLALCDHDTLEGLAPMGLAVEAMNAQGETPLTFFPGVEVSTGEGGRIHVLGYGADSESPLLTQWFEGARERRQKRFEQMLSKLTALGISVPRHLLPSPSHHGPVGRAHLARALIQMGVVTTMAQAFDRYLAEGKPIYVPYDHLSAGEAVALLRKAGCVPVLAHPARLPLATAQRPALIQSLQDQGLLGIEVFHPSASRRDVNELYALAKRQGLLVTGGSDFHGDENTAVRVGTLPAGWTTLQEDVAALQKALAS